MAYQERNNAIVDKSLYFGCDIVNLCKILKEQKHFEIASQLLKSGTSIGANTRESQRGVSTKDFKNKLANSFKRSRRNFILVRYY